VWSQVELAEQEACNAGGPTDGTTTRRRAAFRLAPPAASFRSPDHHQPLTLRSHPLKPPARLRVQTALECVHTGKRSNSSVVAWPSDPRACSLWLVGRRTDPLFPHPSRPPSPSPRPVRSSHQAALFPALAAVSLASFSAALRGLYLGVSPANVPVCFCFSSPCCTDQHPRNHPPRPSRHMLIRISTMSITPQPPLLAGPPLTAIYDLDR
jgi:hypothetical protein